MHHEVHVGFTGTMDDEISARIAVVSDATNSLQILEVENVDLYDEETFTQSFESFVTPAPPIPEEATDIIEEMDRIATGEDIEGASSTEAVAEAVASTSVQPVETPIAAVA